MTSALFGRWMVLEPSLRAVLPQLMSDTTTKIPAKTGLLDRLLVRDVVPDPLIRFGIRRLLRQRLAEEDRGEAGANLARKMEIVGELGRSPIAIETAAANAQHYEVPTRFYQLCLGPNLKYSSCLYRTFQESLGEAEEDRKSVV